MVTVSVLGFPRFLDNETVNAVAEAVINTLCGTKELNLRKNDVIVSVPMERLKVEIGDTIILRVEGFGEEFQRYAKLLSNLADELAKAVIGVLQASMSFRVKCLIMPVTDNYYYGEAQQAKEE